MTQDFERIQPVKRHIKGQIRNGAKITFTTYAKQKEACKAKTNLGKRPLWVSEDLTKQNLSLAIEAYILNKQKLIHKNWTYDEIVYIMEREDSRPMRVTNRCTLDEIRERNEHPQITTEETLS